jgi:maltose-binding protein MalE
MIRLAQMEWGDLPAWVSATSTLFALIFAAVAAVAARRAYRIESERDQVNAGQRRQQEAFLRRAQAALVSAWWSSRNTPTDPPQWGAFVRNASETPVYQARLSVVNVHDPDVSDHFDLAVVPPAAAPEFYRSRVVDEEMTPDTALDFRVEMTFTDSTGNRWSRDQQGRLSEVQSEVTIWADTQRTRTLDRFSADFLASHHVKVLFRTCPIETLRRDFLVAVKAGETADVLVGPHDWIGNLVQHRVIDPIDLTRRRREAFVQQTIEAMTYEDALYGIPYASDSIALLRNLELAPQPPATVEEMLAHGRRLCGANRSSDPVALQVGTGDGFYVYPLYSSAGGRLFSRDSDGGWDVNAVAGAGSAAALGRLRALGEQGEGILRREIDRDAAIRTFIEGRTPYLVCAPWGMGEARAAGVRVAASPMPPFENAQPARSLIAVHGFFLASASRNKAIAQDLIGEHLTRTEVALALYAAQPRTPALRTALDSVFGSDAEARVFHDQCEVGDLIPSAPDVVAMWEMFNRAEVDTVAGDGVEAVVQRLRQSVVDANRMAGRRQP